MKLRVKPLDRRNAGKGIATLSRDAMSELGVTNGDFIRMKGESDTAVLRVRASRNRDRGSNVIGIDGQTRKGIGTRIDQIVRVKPVDVSPASRLAVVLPDELQIKSDLASYIHKKLANRGVRAGETVAVTLGFSSLNGGSNRRIPVQIVDSDPGGTVVVTGSTSVEIVDQPPEDVESDDDDEGTDPPGITYEDVGGLDEELDIVREMIELPMRHPELFQALGIKPPQGVLLHGPPGTGKTLIAKAVATEIDANFQTISGPEIMSRYHGESEERLREVFETAEEAEPAIVFIDEIDSIAPQRDNTEGDVERRVVAQLLSLMDGLRDRGQITVIGTTNRIDAVDPALRRGGRFDREAEIGAPDTHGRAEILRIHTREMPLAEDIDLTQYASSTHGFVGADLESLVREAAMNALRRVRPELDLDSDKIDAETLDSLTVTEYDFRRALREIEPSALREVFVETPDVTWDDVGGLAETKARLREAIQWPLEFPEAYRQVDLQSTKGILLHGPPGTGKTLLAKAVANEAQSNFISVNGPELFDKYVGESEKGVREIFSKARENAPTVIFFDEIDAIASQRGSGDDSQVGERVVSQLLTELDGLEELEDVVVVAATNRPDLIDDALTRAGRIEQEIEVGEPNEETRREILAIHTETRPLADDVDLDAIAAATAGFVGAELASLCRTAATAAVREHVEARADGQPAPVEEMALTQAQFAAALTEIGDDDREFDLLSQDDERGEIPQESAEESDSEAREAEPDVAAAEGADTETIEAPADTIAGETEAMRAAEAHGEEDTADESRANEQNVVDSGAETQSEPHSEADSETHSETDSETHNEPAGTDAGSQDTG